jgi:lipopolysaccharide exporter
MVAIAKGASWMVLFRIAERSLGLVSTVILARLLLPSDFGLVAMAISVIAMLEVATAFSFDIMLIQKPELERRHYDTAWTLNIGLGVACAAATAVLALPAAGFFREPGLASVMIALSAAWLLQGFENVGIVDFRRRMDFSREFAFLVGKKLIGFVVVVSLALWLRNVWALVGGIIASRAGGVVLSYAMHSYRPRPSLAAAREIMSFSVWLMLYNALNFLALRFSHFLIGRTLGSGPLGIFTVAFEIAQLPTTELVSAMNRAIFPGFARMAENGGDLRRGFLDVTAGIALFAVPAAFGLAALATPVIRLVLGENWLAAAPLIEILAFAGAIAALSSHNYSTAWALGKSAATSAMSAARALALVALALALVSPFGLVGVAWAEFGSICVQLAASCYFVLPALAVGVGAYLRCMMRPLIAGALMGVAVAHIAMQPVLAGPGPWAQVGAAVPAGMLIYGALIGLLWLASGRPDGVESKLLERLRPARAERP